MSIISYSPYEKNPELIPSEIHHGFLLNLKLDPTNHPEHQTEFPRTTAPHFNPLSPPPHNLRKSQTHTPNQTKPPAQNPRTQEKILQPHHIQPTNQPPSQIPPCAKKILHRYVPTYLQDNYEC
ncbi:hypothetical protein BDR22DRAFT_169815 [Usnea florida]